MVAEGLRHIGSVGYPQLDVALTNSAEILQYFADHFAIRNDDAGAVGVAQRSAEQGDGLHRSFHPDNRNVFAYPVRFREYDGQARHDVAQYALGRESDARPRHAETGQQGQQFDAEILQRHHDEQPEHEDAREAGQQLANGGFESKRCSPRAVVRATHPATNTPMSTMTMAVSSRGPKLIARSIKVPLTCPKLSIPLFTGNS